jgi:branched-subunit amino acid transport protein
MELLRAMNPVHWNQKDASAPLVAMYFMLLTKELMACLMVGLFSS